ncbi:probable pectinesterase/pectinesterase inhibitor 20 isoform X1 [Cucurbita pepo subsp. pepo]|uniref:probable pectinesterase/pectinesterase inhibitor 20 isoform X1 n=1 Tax=Cucurbita pepo subsp. pepo TaxID=3664 RepID=UPI000C9D74F5|nr:probable pectinesterase/pectinesterase inhibitor 20 isoform X1 [Cucurbita pepo subsp. pepo]XP_023524145.1 probable pectinesterase/pectinesterase inhibitor 20 isoform X1 [Cucurbita pepo subsp. pepo]XP_023524146.1 probable pectinesterase/pectinesterase inhibitor 20 isoform X1 [Cucurbita pepo subsp. pepo]
MQGGFHPDGSLNDLFPAKAICKFTSNPSYCISVLQKSSGNVYESGRFSMRRSLSKASAFLNLIEKHLQNSSTLPKSVTGGLKDCQYLAQLNINFLSNSFRAVNGTDKKLTYSKADYIQSLLSAILTNIDTCLDGLNTVASGSSLEKDLLAPLIDCTKSYSLSLDLFTKGWVPRNRNRTRDHPVTKHLRFRKGPLPLRMSKHDRVVYNSVANRRRLSSSSDDGILVNGIVVVSQDGTGNFLTITEAVNAAPNNSLAVNGYFLIYIAAGVYQEYVSIPSKKKYLLMIGDGINQTIITGNQSVADGWTTFNSATFAVAAEGFMAVNITFQNTAGAIKGQAVAMRSGADMSIFYSCSFEGYQDTLYTHSLRQFFRECDIYGTVDFIFGNAAVVFQNCNIYPRLPRSGQTNMITAQGRSDPNQNTGTSIHNCTIRATSDLAASKSYMNKTYLGRPWKQYSRTVYMQTFIDGFINPAGWDPWSGEYLSTLYYAEYNNTGAGSNTKNRVTWPGYHVISNATDASNFTVSNFLVGDAWLPPTGVPYTGGFI